MYKLGFGIFEGCPYLIKDVMALCTRAQGRDDFYNNAREFVFGDKPTLIVSNMEFLVEDITTNVDFALNVANFSGSRIPQAEESIARFAWSSVRYAEIIDDRFKLGEPEIAKEGAYVLQYAKFLKRRFLKGERAIAEKGSLWCIRYAKLFGVRFPKFECFIEEDAYHSAQYVKMLMDDILLYDKIAIELEEKFSRHLPHISDTEFASRKYNTLTMAQYRLMVFASCL